MDYAVIDGREVLAEDSTEVGVAVCPSCGHPVCVVGLSSPRTIAHYRHNPGAPDNCPEGSKNQLVLDGYDRISIENTKLRQMAEMDAVYREEIKNCWTKYFLGSFALGFNKEMKVRLERARRKGIWFYSGMTKENLPLLLLLLCDLRVSRKGESYLYRYKLIKSRNNSSFRPNAAIPRSVEVLVVKNGVVERAKCLPRGTLNPIPWP